MGKGGIKGMNTGVNKECLVAVLTGNAMQESGDGAGEVKTGCRREVGNNYDLI